MQPRIPQRQTAALHTGPARRARKTARASRLYAAWTEQVHIVPLSPVACSARTELFILFPKGKTCTHTSQEPAVLWIHTTAVVVETTGAGLLKPDSARV